MRDHITIRGPVGKLEALYETPEDRDPRRVAVVCHPHPLHGGTMHTTVVHRIAKGLRRAGIATLRFQFRGVGDSEGSHDHGKGEKDDVRAALLAATERLPQAANDLILAGFSFGARVGLDVAATDDRVTNLVGVGLPLSRTSFDFLLTCEKPKLLIQGALDEFGARDVFETFARSVPEPKQIVVVDGAGHLFERLAHVVENEVAAAFG